MGASVIGVSSDKIATQREFSTKECRDKFPVLADPDFKVINAYDAAFTVPVAGAMFANRISYVIAPDGKILRRSRIRAQRSILRMRSPLCGSGATRSGNEERAYRRPERK